MNLLDEVRSATRMLNRIEAALMGRAGLPAEDSERAVSTSSLDEVAGKCQLRADQRELESLRFELNALSYELHHKVLLVAERPDEYSLVYMAFRAEQLREAFGDVNRYTLGALIGVNVDDAAVLLGRAQGIEEDPWLCMAIAEREHLDQEGKS